MVWREMLGSMKEALEKQIGFLRELDRLKSVARRSILSHESRRENSAEHSWHVAMVAMTLVTYSDEPVDINRVVRMLLVHDIVEIDAGDTYIYDTAGNEGKMEREMQAADRLFGMLPPEQCVEFRALWDEFESKATPESRYANACDRLIPLLHNYWAKGHSWEENGVQSADVIRINSTIRDASASLWEYARTLIEDSLEKGYLRP
ncbi:MAG: 5'-nucleotidase [Verrucomicrobia bacterium ADurb.Bin474]|nr:MAG: 5'-nucleotidase [Verrucomicrobia bacterium ADurb.Bin474]